MAEFDLDSMVGVVESSVVDLEEGKESGSGERDVL